MRRQKGKHWKYYSENKSNWESKRGDFVSRKHGIGLLGHPHTLSVSSKYTLLKNYFRQSVSEAVKLADKIQKGHRVGLEWSASELKNAMPSITEVEKWISDEFLTRPTETALRELIQRHGIRRIHQDVLLAAIARKKGGVLIPLDSKMAKNTVTYRLDEALKLAVGVRNPARWGLDELAPETIERTLKSIELLVSQFPKLQEMVRNVSTQFRTSDEQGYTELGKLLQRMQSARSQISIAMRDQYMARRALKEKCRWIISGAEHVTGMAELLKTGTYKPYILHSYPHRRSGFTASGWKEYIKRKQTKGKTRKQVMKKIRKQIR